MIDGNATLALKRLKTGATIEPTKLIEIFDKITLTTKRISQIVKGLRTFARSGETIDLMRYLQGI